MSSSSSFFVYDVCEKPVSDTCSKCEIVLFCINEVNPNNTVAIRLTDVPFFLFLQVPNDFQERDLNALKDYVNQNVKINSFTTRVCNRTHCCGKKKPIVVYKPQNEGLDTDEDTDNEEESVVAAQAAAQAQAAAVHTNIALEYMNTCPCAKTIQADIGLTCAVERMELIDTRFHTMVYYEPNPQKFVKVYLTRPFLTNKVKNCLYRFVHDNEPKWAGMEVHEAYNDAVTQVCYSMEKQKSICTGAFVRMTKFVAVSTNNKKTTCEEEYFCSYKNLEVEEENGDRLPVKMTRRTIAFDIEVEVSNKGRFCTADRNPILCIGVYDGEKETIFGYGEEKSSKYGTLYANEKEMLQAFLTYVATKVDISIGYNSNTFDWPYIFDRAEVLGVPYLTEMSRIINYPSIVLKTTRTNKQRGEQTTTYFDVPGKLFVDILPLVKEMGTPRSSYKLGRVAQEELGHTKHDMGVEVDQCAAMIKQGGEAREEVYKYCIMDAKLAWELEEKMSSISSLFVQSKTFGMLLKHRMTYGMQIRLTQLGRQTTGKMDFLFAKHEKLWNNARSGGGQHGWKDGNKPATESKATGSKATGDGEMFIPAYKLLKIESELKGATVMEPLTGYYGDTPVANLDFASLYPSLIIAYNLSSDTLCRSEEEGKMYGAVQMPNGYWFVPSTVRKGILPLMCEELLKKRNHYKTKMKEENDPEKKKNYDLQQNAFKIANNSIYGGTNAKGGSFYCPYVAATVTLFGRESFVKIKQIVDGIKGIRAVYGDTDSIFFSVLIPLDEEQGQEFSTLEEFSTRTKIKWKDVFVLGKLMAERINNSGIFRNAQKIVFEKVQFPFILLSAKQYAGICYEALNKPGKLSEKGTVGVKRDTAGFVSRIFSTMVKKLLTKEFPPPVNHSIEVFIREEIFNVLSGKCVDLKEFVIAKKLSKQLKDYANKELPHLQACIQWQKWKPNDAPIVGDKIEYVIVKQYGATHEFQRTRPPFMVSSVFELDLEHYVMHLLQTPLTNFVTALGFTKQRIKSLFTFNNVPIENHVLPVQYLNEKEYLAAFSQQTTDEEEAAPKKKQMLMDNFLIKKA